MAYCHSRQGVVDRKPSRNVDLRLAVHHAACCKVHAQLPVLIEEPDIGRHEICLFFCGKCLYFAGASFQNLLYVWVVGIDDPYVTLTEQPAFARQIICEIRMLRRTDVIL